MRFSLKTGVFKSLLIYITILLLSSCNSREYKHNKDDRESLEIKKDLVQNETPSTNAEHKLKPEIQQEQKSEKEIEKTKEILKKKISNPPPFQSGSSSSGGSASCYGGEIRFYDKDTLSLKRYYVSIPNTSEIKNEEFCKISFKASVDANGDIISIRVNSYGTTTTNQELINQVRDVVKSQLKYNKVDPNTPVFSEIISITIQPN